MRNAPAAIENPKTILSKLSIARPGIWCILYMGYVSGLWFVLSNVQTSYILYLTFSLIVLQISLMLQPTLRIPCGQIKLETVVRVTEPGDGLDACIHSYEGRDLRFMSHRNANIRLLKSRALQKRTGI